MLTLRGLLIRDSESFGPRFRAAKGTVGGSYRALAATSRNGDRPPVDEIVANPCEHWPETKNARRPISRRRALTGRSSTVVENEKAPGTEPSSERCSLLHLLQMCVRTAVQNERPRRNVSSIGEIWPPQALFCELTDTRTGPLCPLY